jgi:ribosomal protein L11 methyltransferase
VTRRHARALETVSVVVPAEAVAVYEAALGGTCGSIGLFHDEAADLWTVEGVKERGAGEAELAAALALAALLSGVEATLRRHATAAEGWLERTRAAFPEQLVGRRFAIRGAHVHTPLAPGRVTLVLDASVAFGSGEHGSTRGCLRALEGVAHRHPRRILDLGTGSGILALAAARLLHRRVLATDIDPWSVRTAAANARANRLASRVRFVRADGWNLPVVAGGGPYDLVLANILARPLIRMARPLARHLAPGGRAVLAGLLTTQARWVLAAHRCHGLVLDQRLAEGNWCTLVLSR